MSVGNTDGSVALVTGAASGMGHAVAARFLDAGWTVLPLDLREPQLEGSVLPWAPVDVCDRAAVREAVQQLPAGALRAVLNVAGIYPPTTLADLSEERYRAVFDTNVLGTLNVIAEAAEVMRGGGAIVNFASVDAFEVSRGQLIYSAAKAAVVALTRSLAVELAADGITVNAVAPGWVDTPGNRATGRMEGAAASIPLGRVGRPEEIAEWVWRLAGESSAYMTVRSRRGVLSEQLREIPGPAGPLEVLMDLPAGAPRAAVVFAHPLPTQGGTMHSKVVFQGAKAFTRIGCAVLRFNFRGVGRSAGAWDEGRGEMDDYRAAVDFMAAQYPDLELWAAGFSFGSYIAMSCGADDDRICTLVGIAPPVDRYEFASVKLSTKPKFIIHGERDELISLKTVREFYARLQEPKEFVEIDRANHLFDGQAGEVGDALEELLSDYSCKTL